MPEYLAPGVYVEEVSMGSKPIEGVSTSTAGLVGVAERGPVNVPQLVTSYGEYQRVFGGRLPLDVFSDSGRAHAYLPLAVEGFFLNGGKRAWVTRVLPEIAERADRKLFFADPANLSPGQTVLLRPAQQGTGTSVNRPALYVLNPNNFQEPQSGAAVVPGDWIRIGEGSRAEYRQIASISSTGRHVALERVLASGHASGAPVRALSVTPAAAPFATEVYRLVDGSEAGALELLVGTANVTPLLTALPAGTGASGWLLLKVGVAPACAYVFARSAVAVGTGQARVSLAQPLADPFPPQTPLIVLNQSPPTNANQTLDLQAHGGDVLLYLPISPPAAFTNPAHIVILEPGTERQEARAIGQLATLPLAVTSSTPFPAGTLGRLVRTTDDDRLVVTPAAVSPFRTVALNDVDGLAPGMSLGFTVGGGIEERIVERIDPATTPATVTLRTGLSAAPAVSSAVLVPGKWLTAAAAPGTVALLLNDRLGLESGDVIRVGTEEIATIREVVGPRGAPPDAGMVFLTQPLRLAHPATVPNTVRRQQVDRSPVSRITITNPSPLPTNGFSFNTVAELTVGMELSFDSGGGNRALGMIASISGASPPIVTLQQALNAPPSSNDVAVPAKQDVTQVLASGLGARDLLMSDSLGVRAGSVLELTLPDGQRVYQRIGGTAQPADPREVLLQASALTRSHDAGQPVLERQRLLLVRALDAGAWGNRLMVSCRQEAQGLVSNAHLQTANPPPAPGFPSTIQLSSLTGVESGTIVELLDPDGQPLNLAFLKVRSVDRANRLAVLDAPGLQATHMAAHSAALTSGQTLRVRSREFSLEVLLRQRPDAAVPSRDDNLLDREQFRHLSMDPRHSRYVLRIVGATWTPGSTVDDLNTPLRQWDQRSEGASSYVRVNDLANLADREAIRLGPEALLDLTPSGLTRSARHQLGEPPFTAGDDVVSQMQDAMYVGTDSNEPSRRTGLYSLKNLLNVSLVAIPGQTTAALQQSLIDHCEEMRYRFAVLDGPAPSNDTITDVQTLRQRYDSKYAALYHPWLRIPDPFPVSPASLRELSIPPSGHVLGLYARVDNERGVHKAPANEVLRGITGLARYLTKGEQDILNPYPQNTNVIRDFRSNSRGLRVWGARCISSDSEYKYINVRRLLIFLEDSIDRGLQWVVFEPNDEPLWARVRRSVTNFLTTVWRNGALEGATPAQGFFVKCDRTTMTRDDIDNGRLICVIGVAPVKPAEFVIIRIGLWTADAEN